MAKNKYLFLLLILPFIGHAEGQEGLVIIMDAIGFVIIFALWAAIVFPSIKLINTIRKKKLTTINKLIIIVITALIALFIWLMLKSDSHPFEGPIDSIIHKKEIEAMQHNTLDNITHGLPDSTIEETIDAMDTGKIGIYIWLNHKSVFVRKNTAHFGSQRQEDSLTMRIVRGWKK